MDETVTSPSTPPPGPTRRPRLLARAARWGGELLTVFVGVYAAFLLNDHQAHRQEQQRREQILAWMEKQFTETTAELENERTQMKKEAEIFDRQLAAGEMPELHAFNFATDYDPSDIASVLGSGGFDLLEVETVREIKGAETTLRVMLATARHDQQLSDALILPNLEKDRSFFYDPATHQLRPAYHWYGEFYKTFLAGYDTLLPQSKKLIAQVRAERQRNR